MGAWIGIFGSALTSTAGMPRGSRSFGFRTESPVRRTNFGRTPLRRLVRHPHRRRSLGGRIGVGLSRRMPCQRTLVGFAEASDPDEPPRRSRLRLVRLVNVTDDCPQAVAGIHTPVGHYPVGQYGCRRRFRLRLGEARFRLLDKGPERMPLAEQACAGGSSCRRFGAREAVRSFATAFMRDVGREAASNTAVPGS